MTRRPILHRLLSTDPDDVALHEGLDDALGPLLEEVTTVLQRDTPTSPPPGLRARLLASAAPHVAFVDRLVALFEVGAETVRRYLRLVTDPDAWSAFAEGAALLHVEGGPALATADVGFVRLAHGATFPRHTHLGEETSIILQGTMIEGDGARHGPGAIIRHPAGSDHVFRAEGELIFAVVVFGVAFEGGLSVS